LAYRSRSTGIEFFCEETAVKLDLAKILFSHDKIAAVSNSIIGKLPETLQEFLFVMSALDRWGSFRSVNIKLGNTTPTFGHLGLKTSGLGWNLGIGTELGPVYVHIGVSGIWSFKEYSPYIGVSTRVYF